MSSCKDSTAHIVRTIYQQCSKGTVTTIKTPQLRCCKDGLLKHYIRI